MEPWLDAALEQMQGEGVDLELMRSSDYERS